MIYGLMSISFGLEITHLKVIRELEQQQQKTSYFHLNFRISVQIVFPGLLAIKYMQSIFTTFCLPGACHS